VQTYMDGSRTPSEHIGTLVLAITGLLRITHLPELIQSADARCALVERCAIESIVASSAVEPKATSSAIELLTFATLKDQAHPNIGNTNTQFF